MLHCFTTNLLCLFKEENSIFSKSGFCEKWCKYLKVLVAKILKAMSFDVTYYLFNVFMVYDFSSSKLVFAAGDY